MEAPPDSGLHLWRYLVAQIIWDGILDSGEGCNWMVGWLITEAFWTVVWCQLHWAVFVETKPGRQNVEWQQRAQPVLGSCSMWQDVGWSNDGRLWKLGNSQLLTLMVTALLPWQACSRFSPSPKQRYQTFIDWVQVNSSPLKLEGRWQCAITSNRKVYVGFMGVLSYILSWNR